MNEYTTIDVVGIDNFNKETAKLVKLGFYPVGQHVIYEKQIKRSFKQLYIDNLPTTETHFTQLFKKQAPRKPFIDKRKIIS